MRLSNVKIVRTIKYSHYCVESPRRAILNWIQEHTLVWQPRGPQRTLAFVQRIRLDPWKYLQRTPASVQRILLDPWKCRKYRRGRKRFIPIENYLNCKSVLVFNLLNWIHPLLLLKQCWILNDTMAFQLVQRRTLSSGARGGGGW